MKPEDWPVQPLEILMFNIACVVAILVVEAAFCAGILTAWQLGGV